MTIPEPADTSPAAATPPLTREEIVQIVEAALVRHTSQFGVTGNSLLRLLENTQDDGAHLAEALQGRCLDHAAAIHAADQQTIAMALDALERTALAAIAAGNSGQQRRFSLSRTPALIGGLIGLIVGLVVSVLALSGWDTPMVPVTGADGTVHFLDWSFTHGGMLKFAMGLAITSITSAAGALLGAIFGGNTDEQQEEEIQP